MIAFPARIAFGGGFMIALWNGVMLAFRCRGGLQLEAIPTTEKLEEQARKVDEDLAAMDCVKCRAAIMSAGELNLTL